MISDRPQARRWGRGLSAAESGQPAAWAGPRPGGVDGAAASRPRKGRHAATLAATACGVDGAAASRPRKVWMSWRTTGIDVSRRWGRGLSAAERALSLVGRGQVELRRWGRGLSAAESSSMHQCRTPSVMRRWGRGLSAAESGWKFCKMCQMVASVDGAAASRPRKEGVHSSEHDNFAASMGPRPLGRGKIVITWDHFRGLSLASMGPRPLGRGKLTSITLTGGKVLASMGPRPLGRGKLPRRNQIRQRGNARRWGRGLSAAERP